MPRLQTSATQRAFAVDFLPHMFALFFVRCPDFVRVIPQSQASAALGRAPPYVKKAPEPHAPRGGGGAPAPRKRPRCAAAPSPGAAAGAPPGEVEVNLN